MSAAAVSGKVHPMDRHGNAALIASDMLTDACSEVGDALLLLGDCHPGEGYSDRLDYGQIVMVLRQARRGMLDAMAKIDEAAEQIKAGAR